MGTSACTGWLAGFCIGQAIAGCAAPSAGTANGPLGRRTTRPDTGSVASAPFPKPIDGVVADAFDQSLPFHNHVAGPCDTTVAQIGGVPTVPGRLSPRHSAAGASAGIARTGGTTVVFEPTEPDDAVPDPAEHAIGPTLSNCGSPIEEHVVAHRVIGHLGTAQRRGRVAWMRLAPSRSVPDPGVVERVEPALTAEEHHRTVGRVVGHRSPGAGGRLPAGWSRACSLDRSDPEEGPHPRADDGDRCEPHERPRPARAIDCGTHGTDTRGVPRGFPRRAP